MVTKGRSRKRPGGALRAGLRGRRGAAASFAVL